MIDVDLPAGTPPGWYWLPSRPNERAYWNGAAWQNDIDATPSGTPPTSSTDETALPPWVPWLGAVGAAIIVALVIFLTTGNDRNDHLSASEAADDLARSVGLAPHSPLPSTPRTVTDDLIEYCFGGSADYVTAEARNPRGVMEQLPGTSNGDFCINAGSFPPGDALMMRTTPFGVGNTARCRIKINSLTVSNDRARWPDTAQCVAKVPD